MAGSPPPKDGAVIHGKQLHKLLEVLDKIAKLAKEAEKIIVESVKEY